MGKLYRHAREVAQHTRLHSRGSAHFNEVSHWYSESQILARHIPLSYSCHIKCLNVVLFGLASARYYELTPSYLTVRGQELWVEIAVRSRCGTGALDQVNIIASVFLVDPGLGG